ncbi:Uncharacterized protein TCAP_04079, partial [Tolypocladium capitatum]
MVTKELPHGDPPASAAERSSTRPHDDPRHAWGDEPSNSVWEDVTPPRDAAAMGGHDTNRQDVTAALHSGQGLLNLAEDDDNNVWDEARARASDGGKLEQVPDALRPGGNRANTNPFLKRKPLPSQSQVAPPVEPLSKLDLNEGAQSTNPWQTPADSRNAPSGYETPQNRSLQQDDPESDPWASNQAPALPAKPSLADRSPALLSLPPEGEPAWNDDSHAVQGEMRAEKPPAATMPEELMGDQHVWDDLGSLDKGKGKVADGSADQSAHLDDWNLVDADPSSSPPKQPAEGAADAAENPHLPLRPEGERPRWIPSRQPVDGRSETYQVKNIRWHDDKSPSNPRTSPILIQNKNGPCPLVALVNALTLTTPADMPDTALVQILRSREQVSLNLLLDAVFDELMSPRRTNSEDSLPDVSDLYAFLQSLHTGMNVNPRFVPTPEMVTAYKRTSLTHLRPSERVELIPGTFESTLEMSLYATFSIPLIHGWLPPQADPAYEALERQAASYEEVQNLLFREEELEDKLSNAGLSESEQELYQDIVTIKIFLEDSATQLTPWGIEVIGKAMRPGTFAILFRNDHFSTLYAHPHTMQLLSLVTDAGYGSHDEVVWESLADVNGEQTEYLSGDFRVVGGGGAPGPGNMDSARGSSGHQGSEWTTVQSKRGKERQQDEDQVPTSPRHEQEDHDLALALQLQEEEEQRHHEEQARRRRERILSEQYIEQQAHRPEPVNRGGARRGYTGAAMAPQRRSSNSVNIPVMTSAQP